MVKPKMTWIFKDRYNPTKQVTIDGEFPQLLKMLEATFFDFRYHNSLSTSAQKEFISKKGVTFAKVIYIHTQISYCLGTHSCQEDFFYNYYCKTVKKLFIDVHPMFAMKKYAEYIALIRSDNEIIMKRLRDSTDDNLSDDK